MEEVVILGEIIITPLLKAKKSLEVALAAEKTDLNRDASIQRFEYTFELAWKTLKRVLKHKGTIANNPRDVFRESAKEGYIEDPELWFVFLESRNLTTHVYDEDIAERIYCVLPSFNTALSKLVEKIISL